jgi:hypothetical protein
MRKLRESTTFPCDVETYWRRFWDDDVARRLYMEGLSFRAFTVVSKTDNDRTLRVQPKMSLPSAVEKILGPSFAYDEIGSLDRASSTWSWRMKSPLGDKLETRGTIRIEAEGSGVRRTDEVVLDARVFGLGSLIESSAEKELRAAWEREFSFWRRELSGRA